MHIHPAVKGLGALGSLGGLLHYLGWIGFLFDKLEKLYEKTQWLRDLISWRKGKKKKRHVKKHR
jgi:hypothetical protein